MNCFKRVYSGIEPRTPWVDVMLNWSRTLSIAAIVALFLSMSTCKANDIYIAQAAVGANNGADCADAYAVSYFNSSSNWGTGKIAPGTTVHLCGTFNAPAGASGYLSFHGSGANGSPITLLFESGAVLAAPYWGGSGAISADGVNYITINGGTNGTVQATANGTALANQQNTYAVYLQSVSNSEVKNLTVSNIYVHTASSSDEGGQNSVGIQWSYGSNVTIDNNTCHDVRTCILYAYQGSSTSSSVNIYSNTVYNVNWGIIVGDGDGNAVLNAPVTIHNNVIHDFYLWDDSADENHHDGVYCFATNTGSTINACSVYNNYIYGVPGTHTNAFVFFSQNTSGMGCSGMQAFNNVLINSADAAGEVPANGFIQDWCSGTQLYNNTMLGQSTVAASGGVCISVNPGVNEIQENNICSTVYLDSYLAPSTTLSASDYNDFYNLSYVATNDANTYFSALATWQKCVTNGCPTSHDMHSSAGNPLLTGTYHLAGNSSAAWQTGVNLTNLGITALNTDAAGVSRQLTGSWDIGAFEDSNAGNANGPSAPTGLVALVN